jgi:tRNA G37 N-methylase TrmD
LKQYKKYFGKNNALQKSWPVPHAPEPLVLFKGHHPKIISINLKKNLQSCQFNSPLLFKTKKLKKIKIVLP